MLVVVIAAACSTGGSPSAVATEPGSSSPASQQASASATPSASVATVLPDPAKNGRIAFGRFLDAGQSTRAIFVINPDGTGEEQLTRPAPGVVDDQPDWSPDGTKIAFERCAPDGCAVWTMNADGRGAKRLGPSGQRSSPAWSPDGATLAVNGSSGPVENDTIKFSRLVVIDAETGRVIRFLDATPPFAGDTGNAAWAPDGTQVVFTRLDSSTGHPPDAGAVFLVNVDGTGLRRLTPWGLNGGHPVWSPDGRLILFRSVEDDVYGNLYTVHPDGSGLHQLTNYDSTTIVLSFSFSPDGRWITFAKSGIGGEPDVFIMRVDGTDLHVVTRTELWDSAPDWGQTT
jgi:TolB protein